MDARTNTVSIHSLAVCPSGASSCATHSETKAPPSWYGEIPLLSCAPR